MPYVKTINEDGVVSDIMAKALDPDVLVNGFTQTTAGVNALDAKAGKTLNDALSNTAFPIVSPSYDIETRGNYKQIQNSNSSSSSFVTASGEHLYTILSWRTDTAACWQLAITTGGNVWTRSYVWWNSAWSAWSPVTPIVWEHTFIVSGGIAAGTIGTRGAQMAVDNPYPNYQLTGIFVANASDSSAVHPLAFYSGGKIYCNWYRSSASAITEAKTTVVVRAVFSGLS